MCKLSCCAGFLSHVLLDLPFLSLSLVHTVFRFFDPYPTTFLFVLLLHQLHLNLPFRFVVGQKMLRFALQLTHTRGIRAATVLERLPVVLAEPPQFERDYEAWKEKRDLRFLKQYPAEWNTRGAPASGAKAAADTADETLAEDDAFSTQFRPAERRTQADETNDFSSLERRLDKRLFLLVKSGKDSPWAFPSAAHKEGEALRKTAERALPAVVGSVYFVGNAPAHHLDKDTFFFRAQLVNGKMKATSGTTYAWVAKEELVNFLGADQTEKVLPMLWD